MIIFAFITLVSCGQNETKQKELGQTIQKGNMVTMHTITVELKPNVTMDQVLDFYNTKWGPDADKYFGLKCFFANAFVGPNVLKTRS